MDLELSSAAITAVGVLSGVVISQAAVWFGEASRRRHARRQLLRQKYEELANHLTDSLAAFALALDGPNNSTAQSLIDDPAVAARRVYALCLIYFPLLQEEARSYLNACLDFDKSLVKNPEAAIANGKAVGAARKALDDKIAKLARKYASD